MVIALKIFCMSAFTTCRMSSFTKIVSFCSNRSIIWAWRRHWLHPTVGTQCGSHPDQSSSIPPLSSLPTPVNCCHSHYCRSVRATCTLTYFLRHPVVVTSSCVLCLYPVVCGRSHRSNLLNCQFKVGCILGM